MADLEQKEFSRSTTDEPPVHYTVKIKSFSLLAKNNMDIYETASFEAGGYKWSLVIYPKGNKNKDIKDHISLYLAIEEESNAQLCAGGWEVYAVFRLFLLDQTKDNYLVIQDASEKGRRFHAMKTEWGFDQFIPLTVFDDPSSGYLVNDACVFGAEVFVCRERSNGKGECLSMRKDPISYKHAWRIESFSSLTAESQDSKAFAAGDHKWKIQMHPQGKGSGTGTHVSLYLALAEPTELPAGCRIYVEFTLRILDQIYNKHYFGKANYWFSSSKKLSGWPRFISLAYFSQPNAGYLKTDNCLVEAEVTIHGVAQSI